MLGRSARDFLRTAALGTRVVVRYHLDDVTGDGTSAGATDALGPILSRDKESCVVETKRGPETVLFSAIIAAKPVPPAPEPRHRRGGPSA